MTETQSLLAEFVKNRSETAFRELVARYLDLVYSTARRLVAGDAHLAEDVAQAVFLHLAQKARTLRPDSSLGGWLHRDTCHVAANLMRGERRRQKREQQAVAMNSLLDHSAANLAQLAPVLDDAINQLGAEDRAAILLRFYEQRDLRSVGEALGSSENAAQKRVARALEELRALLKHRGIALSGAALGTILATEAVTAAPAQLAAAISTAVLANAASAAAPTLTVLKLMAAINLKSTVVTALALAAILTPLLLQHQAQARLHDLDDTLRRQTNQLAQLAADNQRLALLNQKNSRPPADTQLNELLKLRSEVGRLQRTVAETTAANSGRPMSPEEKLAYLKTKYATQVARLKEWLAAHPSEKIPELDHIPDGNWIDAVESLEKNDDFELAISSLRRNAQWALFPQLAKAVQDYSRQNNGQLPADLSQVTSYLKNPIDDAILQRYEIAPASSMVSLLQFGGDWVVTQVAPVNPAQDSRMAYGLDQQGRLTGTIAGRGITNLWARPNKTAMTKFKTITLITLVVASMAASLMIHQRSEAATQDRAVRLQQQAQQLANLKAEQQRLSGLAAHPLAEDHSVELAKLRSQAESLQKQTNELVKQSKLRLTSQPSRPAATPKTYTPEYLEQMRQARGTKGSEARDIATAMMEYAGDHQKQYPSSLDQITPYLAKENRTLSGTNQFEIIFQGSLDQLDGIPQGSIAVVRETQPWLTPDGRLTRVYGMVPGIGQTVSSDDNFQSWEAEHVISPPNPVR